LAVAGQPTFGSCPSTSPSAQTTTCRSFSATSSSAASGAFLREQRAVFVFHHHLGLTHLEIAEQLGVPLGTVKSRLHYATNTLRAALESDLRSSTDTSREHLA